MRNVWTIARRELYAYFSSPIAYVTMAAFLGLMGLLYYVLLILTQMAELIVLNNLPVIFVLMLYTTVITMRSLAEEQRSGTIELVLTAPVRDWEVVVGKYLAGLLLFLLTLVVTLYQPIILTRLGNPDVGAMVSSYLGFILLAAALLAVGTLASSLTRNQVVAAVIAVAIGVALWLIEYLGMGSSGATGNGFISQVALLTHYFDFQQGVIDTQHVVYYVSLVALCLFLATRVLETRRWR